MEVLSSFKFRLGVDKFSRFATILPDSKACLNSDWNDIRQPEKAIQAPRLSSYAHGWYRPALSKGQLSPDAVKDNSRQSYRKKKKRSLSVST